MLINQITHWLGRDRECLPIIQEGLKIIGVWWKIENAGLEQVVPSIASGNKETLAKIAEMDEQVDNLHAQIISYLGRINRGELSDEHTRELIDLMAAANDLKHIGDLIQSDLVDLGVKRFNAGITVSEHSHGAFSQLGEEVSNTLADAVMAVAENDNLIAS